MSVTTDAIVLSLQPHSDKAFVLHAYTRAGGRINYRVYGIGRKNAIGIYTPLSLIQITSSPPSPSKPPTVKEAVPLTAQRSYGEAIYKNTVRLFICEVLYHVLRHPMPDEPMFDFIADAIQELDATDEPQNFHLQFLVGLAAKLGFGIDSTNPLHTFGYAPLLPLTRTQRQQALRELCAYFAEHVETWENPKSLDILMEVFD